MAPIGGGPPVGSSNSFTGTAQALEIAGKRHVYAYSGTFAASESVQTLFNFTSPGSGYIVATLTVTAPIRMTAANITVGTTRGYQLDFNGQTVGLYKVESFNEDMPSDSQIQILIPPFTAVVLTCIDSDDDANMLGTANITGRIYRD